MSKERLVVHLKLYNGRRITYKKTGEAETPSNIHKLIYGEELYKLFIRNIRNNGMLMEDDSAQTAVVKVTSNEWDTKTGTWSDEFKDVTDSKEAKAIVAELQAVYDKTAAPGAQQEPVDKKDAEIAELREQVKELTASVKELSKKSEKSSPNTDKTSTTK